MTSENIQRKLKISKCMPMSYFGHFLIIKNCCILGTKLWFASFIYIKKYLALASWAEVQHREIIFLQCR